MFQFYFITIGRTGGVVGSAVFTDANSNIVPATFTRFMGNESKESQTKLLRGIVRAHEGINRTNVRIITDGEKGFPGVIQNEVPLATQILDKRHKKEALRKLPGGKEAATAYEKCFEAKTPAEVDIIKNAMNPEARKTRKSSRRKPIPLHSWWLLRHRERSTR